MMPIGGQIPAIWEPQSEPVLILGFIDSADALCCDADGRLRPITYSELTTAWYFDPDIGVWDTAQPSYEEVIRAAQNDQLEDVPNELHDPDGAGDGDPAGRGDRGDVDPDQA